MTKRFSIFTIFQCLAVCVVFAQQPEDSVRVHDLPELQVKASATTTSTSLVQTLSAAQLEKLNVLQASDAMKHLSGVQVKDYGGVGGLKTVSIRSLGANYTAVAVDGIAVSDYQTGQIDLGRFSLENIESIRLNIGESDNIFQPARNQALGGLIQLISQNSLSSESKREEWKAGLKAGSWQLWNPFVTYSRAFNPQWNINLSSSFLTTKGDYPFQIHYGQTDSTSWHRRINSDVKRGNAELNLNGKFRNGGRLNAKLYAFLSERGIPGRVIFYNPYSGEKVKDCNLFAQVNYNQSLNEKWQWQANAKGSRSVMNDWGAGLDNQYAQREYYLNATLLYMPSEKLSFSWANDAIRGDMESRFRYPESEVSAVRNTWLSSLAGKYESSCLTATARFLYQQSAEKNFFYSHFSPFFSLSFQVFKSLKARAFYKNTYRLPTFGDIYFSPFPNLKLKAENAHQFNLGATWATGFFQNRARFSLSADGYFNRVENKIVALPRYSIVTWTSVNYGQVDIKGADVQMNLSFQWKNGFSVDANANYTFQEVRDKTAGSSYYNAHLPLTPRHIANASMNLKTPWFDFSYNWMYSGARYKDQTSQYQAWLPAYSEHSLSVLYPFHYQKMNGKLSLECLNLWNTQYAVIPDYPMPGRNIRLGLKFIY